MPQITRNRLGVPYDVELRTGNVSYTETVGAATPALAVKAATLMHPGSEVLRVTRTWTPIDRCVRCGSIVFECDGAARRRNGGLHCWECG